MYIGNERTSPDQEESKTARFPSTRGGAGVSTWFKKIPPIQVLLQWVANSENPYNDKSGSILALSFLFGNCRHHGKAKLGPCSLVIYIILVK